VTYQQQQAQTHCEDSDRSPRQGAFIHTRTAPPLV
jgi:hypothetical protein